MSFNINKFDYALPSLPIYICLVKFLLQIVAITFMFLDVLSQNPLLFFSENTF